MDAAADSQLRLLELQGVDSRLDRLAVRRRTLPATARVAAAEAELARLSADAVGHQTAVTDHARAQAKIDADVEQVRARADRDRDRLDQGSVSSAKELESLQSEILSLRRRQEALEDDELAVMELRESAELALAVVRAQEEEQRGARAVAEQERDAEWTQIDADTDTLRSERGALAAELPADLLALYERIRADKGGVAAAGLVRRRCEGCHLELAGMELATVKAAAPETVLRCDECGRILIRTPDSGLA